VRAALYYAPAPDDPLWTARTTWLGRDPASGATPAQPDLPDIAAITADARRYGFHATLKPPMRLRPGLGLADLRARAASVLRDVPAFDLPKLAVADLHGFLALRETRPCPALQVLADACVAGVDEFRAPPDAAELQRRRGSGLSAEREAMLVRWGYPDVFGTWFFHMTLTRRLNVAEKAIFLPAAASYFAAAVAVARRVETVSLFVADPPEDPFRLVVRFPLKA